MASFSRCFVFALAVLTIVGCGSGDRGYLTGTVSLDGTPVGPGTITFDPVSETTPGAMASFGEDGRYTVFSSGRKEGAVPGEYRVRIHGGEEFGTEGEAPVETKIPARYGQPGSTELTVIIEPGQNTRDFELTP